ncbi:MAG: hypothetical protein WCQ57_09695 [Verrucomicrobiota bacterium]
MRTILALTLLSLALASCAAPPVPATKLERTNVLPLALNDHFQFRKVKLIYNQMAPAIPTTSPALLFERARINWGAVNNYDIQRRFGNYFTFFWRTSETADVTFRLEYRVAALGNQVVAQERYYTGARGSFMSEFSWIGDDYLEFGVVTAWRAILIVDGRIVALKQSFMWK